MENSNRVKGGDVGVIKEELNRYDFSRLFRFFFIIFNFALAFRAFPSHIDLLYRFIFG